MRISLQIFHMMDINYIYTYSYLKGITRSMGSKIFTLTQIKVNLVIPQLVLYIQNRKIPFNLVQKG